jgi:hypothetical protein
LLLLTPLLLDVEEVVARGDMLIDVGIKALEDWLEEPLKDPDEPLAAAETEALVEVVKLTVGSPDPVLVFAEGENVREDPLPNPIDDVDDVEDVDDGEATTEEPEPAEEDKLIRLVGVE